MIVEHPSRPSLPAETAMKVPAARTLSTAVCRLPTEHPSSGGQRYELPIAFGQCEFCSLSLANVELHADKAINGTLLIE